VQPFAQRVEERGARIDHHLVIDAVDTQPYVHGGRRGGLHRSPDGRAIRLRQERCCRNDATSSRRRLEQFSSRWIKCGHGELLMSRDQVA
jgi:hypothetical protein